jgi:hypothetical protein
MQRLTRCTRKSTFAFCLFSSDDTLRMYNETLRDLLVADVASPKKLDLQHDSHGGVRVANLSVYDLSSAAHGLSLIEAGCRARSVGAHTCSLALLHRLIFFC